MKYFWSHFCCREVELESHFCAGSYLVSSCHRITSSDLALTCNHSILLIIFPTIIIPHGILFFLLVMFMFTVDRIISSLRSARLSISTRLCAANRRGLVMTTVTVVVICKTNVITTLVIISTKMFAVRGEEEGGLTR